MRISDWSSDVCSSDLIDAFARLGTASDRFNMFDRFAGGGLKFGGWVPGRPEDEFGIAFAAAFPSDSWRRATAAGPRSEEHTSELQSLMRISYAVFCLKNKNKTYV